MFVLFHFIFMLIKIAIQATVYATLTFIIMYVLSKTTEIGIIKKWMNRKFLTWWVTGLTFSIGLFFFAFSYWGNHGLGDSARLPVGHGQAIHNGDGVWTYFYPDLEKTYNQLHINDFALKDDKICAEQAKENESKYIVFDFKTSELIEFQSQQEYEKYATKHDLPETAEFKDFLKHYHDFWSGWRFYLLP